MRFLKKLAKESLSGVAQRASNIAQTKMGETVASRRPQVSQQTRHASPPAPPSRQPQVVRSEGALEGAFAGLVGSAERFIDKMGGLIGVCPNCQTTGTANTACEECGTQIPPTPPQSQGQIEAASAEAQSDRSTNCGNCGATIRGVVCEYCDSRVR